MAGTTITGSPNIRILDSKIVANLCNGIFYIDATPSIFIGSGASNVLGIKIQVTNPFGVIIKAYGGSYDIAAPLTAVYQMNIPTQAGKYQYGVYTFTLELTDAGGTKYYITKSKNICSYPDGVNPCEGQTKLIADCKNGTLTLFVAEPIAYQGVLSESKTQSWTVNFPTASGIAAIVSANGNFSVQLFQGVYKVVGEVCATYNLTDNIYVKIGYDVTIEKNVKCLLDYTCIFPKIEQLNKKITEDCSEKDKEANTLLILDALRLLKSAELANDAGEDASDYINELEKLLGVSCTSECNPLAPIVNNSPSTNFQISGCNVSKQTVGLTDIYTINNYEYIITPDDDTGTITISAPSLYGCTKTQTIVFSAPANYAAIKSQINNTTEYNWWAAIFNKAIDTIDASCLGYTNNQWLSLTFLQRFQALVNKACAGGNCTSTIGSHSVNQSGANAVLSWSAPTGAYSVDIYLDGNFVDNVLSSITTYTLENVNNGSQRTYRLVPRCTNGSIGTAVEGTFTYLNCPSIAAPTVSTNNANGVTCPYDLTALVSPPPLGITTEWHTANNTLAATLVPSPTAVSSGVYYAFSKDSSGCYSTSTVVTVTCASSSCTAPQNLLVTAISGGFLAQFQSAAYPPPANSYTVKRRLTSDPDVLGSYTTIGTPVWNASTSRWEITDASASNNVLYTYRAISNCGSTTPSVDYNFANLTCPSLTFTPGSSTIGYSFTNVGGGVDKYEVRIYADDGVTLLQTLTHIPAFSTPITGTFTYLTAGTNYKVQVKVYIGTFSKTCPFGATNTTSDSNAVNVFNNLAVGNINDVQNISGYVLASPLMPSESDNGTHSGFTATIAVIVSGSGASGFACLYKDDLLIESIPVSGTGTYTFGSEVFTTSNTITIYLDAVACPAI